MPRRGRHRCLERGDRTRPAGAERPDDDDRLRRERADHHHPDQPEAGRAEDQPLALDVVDDDGHDRRAHGVADRADRQVEDRRPHRGPVVVQQRGRVTQEAVVADVPQEPHRDEDRQPTHVWRLEQEAQREPLVGGDLRRRRLGQLEPDGETDQGDDAADDEQQPPPEGVVGHQGERDEGRDRLADDADQEGVERDPAAPPGGGELADVGRHEVEVGADADPGDESEDHEHDQSLRSGVAEGADRREQDGEDQHPEAADPVGEGADDQGPDDVRPPSCATGRGSGATPAVRGRHTGLDWRLPAWVMTREQESAQKGYAGSADRLMTQEQYSYVL